MQKMWPGELIGILKVKGKKNAQDLKSCAIERERERVLRHFRINKYDQNLTCSYFWLNQSPVYVKNIHGKCL